jgi:hypothetical protein
MRQPLHLYSTAADELVVTRVRPKAIISDARRQKALQAMKGRKVDEALKGVDAQMLELLSEHFLYPENIAAAADTTKTRPKGRPEFVPGAMNYDTMLRFRERQEVIEVFGNGDSPIAAYSSQAPALGTREAPPSDTSNPKKGRGVKGAKATNPTETDEINGAVDATTSGAKQRKRVVKSLPKPQSKEEKELRANSRKRTKGTNLELQKYYRTELLSSDEEYSLGMKIQFMVKCEAVHEGLASNLLRLPTVQEWAEACG